jgi:hypothetical protein
VLENKFPDIYKLELLEILKVHPIFHVLLLKPITRDASRLNRKHTSRPSLDLVNNKLKFEMESVFKSKQLRGRKWEYLVNWKGYHPI